MSKEFDTYVKSSESAFSVIGGMLVLMLACMTILPSDVIVDDIDPSTLESLFMQYIIGFFLLYISVMIMQEEWIEFIQKLSRLNTFSENPSQLTTPTIALGLFVILMLLKVIFAYVPFLGYIFSALLVWGYLYLMRKMSQSKSGVGKAVFVVMVLIVLLIMLAVAAFFYLIREG